ncbi:MAG TPA: hypothetical protein IAC14_07870 [Candidatus Scybalomonas excrementigallinarum]|nr:hypothetical protein [Candidatus Scybalomonas excrementigallinarum]
MKSIDIFINFIGLSVFGIIVFIYYKNIFNNRKNTVIFLIITSVLIGLVEILLNVEIINCISSIIGLQICFYGTAKICKIYIDEDIPGQNQNNTIYNQFFARISSNINQMIEARISIETKRQIALIFQGILYFFIILIPPIMAAMTWESIPKKYTIINDEIVLYNNSEQYLVTDYREDNGIIYYNGKMLDLIEKGNERVCDTEKRILQIKRDDNMAIKGAKTIQEYQIMKFIEDNFKEGSVSWKIMDDNTFEVKDKTGDTMTMTMDEIKKGN